MNGERAAALVGLDWGTTSLRAYLLDGGGAILEERARPWGVLRAPEGGFGAAFGAVAADWRSAHPAVATLAAGMIGSSEGWFPVPYLACPAGPAELAAALLRATTDAGVLWVVPGVAQSGPTPDVMRGEETQIAGVLASRPESTPEATLVLPGTHSKWVLVAAGKIVRFTTFMTGELFELLVRHSILGRPLRAARDLGAAPQPGWAAFDRGVADARRGSEGGLGPRLFQTRTLVLNASIDPADSAEYLSGLLIGDEVRSGCAAARGPITVTGDAALCARYVRALGAWGVAASSVEAAAPTGLWAIARHAGLIAAAARG